MKTLMLDSWSKKPFRSALGISKDGYPIYTPIEAGKNFVEYCAVDICNGKKYNENYSYVTTYFHPYIMGCFGEGSGTSEDTKNLY